MDHRFYFDVVNEGAWIIKRTAPLFIPSCRIYSEFAMNSVPVAVGVPYDVGHTHAVRVVSPGRSQQNAQCIWSSPRDKHCRVSA